MQPRKKLEPPDQPDCRTSRGPSAMRRSPDRIAEAMLANRRIPRARLEDPDAAEVVSTAITLRAARTAADQVDEEFVTRLRLLLAAELAEVPAAPKLSRRTMIVA